MKIAVTAASGQLGGSIVQALVPEIGAENILALARNPQKLNLQSIPTARGDYDDKESFMEALPGVDALLIVSSNAEPKHRNHQHSNVIDAAVETGVKAYRVHQHNWSRR